MTVRYCMRRRYCDTLRFETQRALFGQVDKDLVRLAEQARRLNDIDAIVAISDLTLAVGRVKQQPLQGVVNIDGVFDPRTELRYSISLWKETLT